MPCEIRDIVFTKTEVMAALAAHDRMCANQEIADVVADVELASGEAPQATVRFDSDAAPVTVSGERLLAALVRYCIENNIVIPRNAKKSVVPAADAARLRIEIGERLADQAAVDLN